MSASDTRHQTPAPVSVCAKPRSGVGRVRHKREFNHSRQLSNTLIPRSPTVGRAAYTVVHLVMLDCTCGVIDMTVDSMLDTCSSSPSME